jgi:hypothetical protein
MGQNMPHERFAIMTKDARKLFTVFAVTVAVAVLIGLCVPDPLCNVACRGTALGAILWMYFLWKKP